MAPLIFLLGTTLLVHATSRFLILSRRPWPASLRAGVAVMLSATGIAYFVGMRAELIEMVPPGLPAPGFLVTLTGFLELAGAAAMFRAPTRPWAAGGLTLMLVAMFPANVHLALTGTDLPWYDTLGPRTLLQALFFAATSAVFVSSLRKRSTYRSPRAGRCHIRSRP